MKFIAKLSPEEEATLTEAYRNHPVFRSRQRVHAILLNNRGYVISRLAAARLLEETGKEASFDTFKRVLKKSLRVETLPTISQGKTQ